MANNDGEIRIGTSIDTSGVKDGVNNISNELKKVTKGDTLKKMGSLGMAITGIGTAAKAAGGLISSVSKTVKELSEAYKTQARAEIQLETAAKNNPYLNGQSVKELKNFASSIQEISIYGDEQLIPLMAELAAAGRTQTEIMDIMNAATDAAASGTIDLDSAVKNLNLSYSGQIGQLGKILPQLKNMSAEELRSGGAVKEMSKSFAGMAQNIAESIGSSEQLANAWGDLKEVVGEGMEKRLVGVRKSLKNIITDTINFIQETKQAAENKDTEELGANKVKDAARAENVVKSHKAQQDAYRDTIDVYNKYIEKEKELKNVLENSTGKKYKKAQEEYNKLITQALNEQGVELAQMSALIPQLNKQIEAEQNIIDKWQKKADTLNAETEAAEAAAEAARKKNEEDAKNAANTEKAENALNTYNETIKAKEKEIETRKAAGEAISREAEELEIASAMLQAYNQLLKDSGGLITGKSAREQSALNEMGLLNALGGVEKELSASEMLDSQMKTLENYYNAVQNSAYITAEKKKEYEEEYTKKHEELTKQREKLDKEEAAARYQSHYNSVQKMASTMEDYTKQYASIVGKSVSLAKEEIESEEEYKLAALENQYNQGLISEEEYTKQKEQIEKESAEKTYKLNMWNWSAQVLQATASGALAVVNALATAGNIYAGIAMAAVATAMTGIELGALMAAKPVKPSFEYGGIVPGNSLTGDHVAINANSREAVLTLAQQKRLLALADGNAGNGSGAVLNMPISIENSVADAASVSIEQQMNSLKILVRKQIKEDIGAGLYNGELMQAQASYKGVRLTN